VIGKLPLPRRRVELRRSFHTLGTVGSELLDHYTLQAHEVLSVVTIFAVAGHLLAAKFEFQRRYADQHTLWQHQQQPLQQANLEEL
jgi:hypothetical protein